VSCSAVSTAVAADLEPDDFRSQCDLLITIFCPRQDALVAVNRSARTTT